MRMFCHAALGFGVALLAGSAAAIASDGMPSPEPLTAEAIFDNARAAATARVAPAYIEYQTSARQNRNGKVEVTTWHVTLRTSDNRAYVEPMHDSPADTRDTTPYVAYKAPLLSPPTFTFGLARSSVASKTPFDGPETPATPAPGPSSDVVIGRSTAVSREYDVVLVGRESLADHDVYHLRLTPRFDPVHNRLRDLWVDTATFGIVRLTIPVHAVVMGHELATPIATVDYAPLDATSLVTHAAAEANGHFLLIPYSGTFVLTTTDVQAFAQEPEWKFDRALLAQHRKLLSEAR